MSRAAARRAVVFSCLWLGSLASAQERTGAVHLEVVPDRADWTYAPGATVTFQVKATRDGHPFPLPWLTYKWGPEMLPPTEEKTLALPAEGLTVKAAGLKAPGFLRLVATASLDGQEYRALATAGFAPEKIAPTVPDPADFDAFWTAGKE